MSSNFFAFIYYFLVIFTTGKSMNEDIHSHLEEHMINNENETRVLVKKEIENIYLSLIYRQKETHHAICSLNTAKKKALCDVIFKNKFYQNSKIRLSKVAVYLSKLPCEKKELSFQFFKSNSVKTIQKMYPCPGRHSIVHTSFMEDDFYSKIYLSTGPINNSVTVYIHLSSTINEEYYIYDYVYNVNFSQLRDYHVTKKEVIKELKLNKQIFSTFGSTKIENMYIKEKYSKENNLDDPICDLSYEKKVALCNIVFKEYLNYNTTPIILNKAASYIFDMSCIIKPIHSLTNNKIMQAEQKLYPCYGRKATKAESATNLLVDKYLQSYYLSSGPNRNTVFVYSLKKKVSLTDIFLFGIAGNINFQNLKPLILTPDDIKAESTSTYKRVKELINMTEKKHKRDLIPIIASSRMSEAEKNEEIEYIFNTDENKFYKIDENVEKSKATKFEYNETQSSTIRNLSNEESITLTSPLILDVISNKNKVSSKDEDSGILTSIVQIGPQVYERLIETMKNNLPDSMTKEMRKKQTHSKVNRQIKYLINKMKLYKDSKNSNGTF